MAPLTQAFDLVKSLRVQMKNTTIQVFELVAPAAKTPLNDKYLTTDGFDPKQLVKPEKTVEVTIKAMKKDNYEISPLYCQILLIMSRIAPGFMLKMLSNSGANEMAVKTVRFLY